MTNDHVAVSGGRTFEQLLADPDQQFDHRSELLSSILEYASAPPASATAQARTTTYAAGHSAWLYTPSATPGTSAAPIAV